MPLCADCGRDRAKLHRHHVIPKSQGGSDGPENVVRICGNCHEDRHTGPDADSIPWQLAHSPEAKAKRSATMRKLWADPEYRDRLTAKRAAHWTPERRAALSAKTKGRTLPDEMLPTWSAAARKRWSKPEYRAKMATARARQTNYRKPKGE